MKVGVFCEESGRTRRALRELGHDAWSFDLLPSRDNSPYHVQGDVMEWISEPFDLIIAHPPCTYLANSGVRWLYTDEGRWDKMRSAAIFFVAMLAANAPRIAVENPVMHKYGREIVGRGPDFTVQPWQFGDEEKKRTCFWTKGLRPLVPTSDSDGSGAVAKVHLCPPGPERAKIRSETPVGLSRAMAVQWTDPRFHIG